MTCWQCHAAASGPVCAGCGAVQPLPPGSDHFTVLGLPRRYDLDRATVEARQRELARALHPDRHVTAAPAARRHSLLWATAVNDAATVLRDPVKRAEYLLKLLGCDVGDEKTSTTRVEPAFLMEILELREELHGACTRRDGARVAAMAADVEQRRAAVLAQLGAGFAALASPPAPAALPPLARHLAVLRYYTRFLDEVAAYEEARYQDGATSAP